MEVKTLSNGDEAALAAFLAPRVESSMFLLANAHAAGLVDRGEALQGTYVAAREEGRIIGVAAHFWNGMLGLQAARSGEHTAEVQYQSNLGCRLLLGEKQ